MERRNFAQVLKDANVDIKREYERLYSMFLINRIQDGAGRSYTLRDYCEMNFMNMPFRGTCLSLDDFDDFYEFSFEKNPKGINLNYLVNFCEYSYNLACYAAPVYGYFPNSIPPGEMYMQQIMRVIDAIGYQFANQDSVTIFVPKVPAAIAVSEIVDAKLSYKVIEYNHHSLQGNIDKKRSIILMLADKLEAQRDRLTEIDKTLVSNIFFMFNNMSIRHNNLEENSKEYKLTVANMPMQEIEQWYDETYQLCLLAFLQLDNIERNKRIKELKEKIRILG